MANQYDTNLKLQAIADAIGDPNGDLIGALDDIATAIGGGGGSDAGLVSDAYNPNNTYNTGNYCIHSNTLYKCIADNVTGSWDSTKWDNTTCGEEFTSLNSDLSNKQDKTWTLFSSSGTGNIPSGASEIIVILSYTNTSNVNWSYSIHVPVVDFAYGKRYFTGYAAGQNNYAQISINSAGVVSFALMIVDGNTVTTNTAARMYYR